MWAMGKVRAFIFVILLCCMSIQLYGQQRVLTGSVTDEQNTPLIRASVTAKIPGQDKGLKWALVDDQGNYRLELESNTAYELNVSYVGYDKVTFLLTADSDLVEYHFRLRASAQQLNEVIINYQYAPVEIKKDTITFRLDAFTSGNERKLREALEKLPGVEVDFNGQVRFQGNVVNTTLVENKLFFGGGSKLAVENIPADAVDRIEMISHFSEVDFLKELLSSDELAMNVKLKKDKRNLLFGDLEAAGGTEGRHMAHAALFYFTPERSLSFIGDNNDIGKAVFTMNDVLRFQGGVSRFITNSSRPLFTDFYGLARDNQNLVKNRSSFAALNFDSDIHQKLNVSGFGIFSRQLTGSRTEEHLQYLTGEPQTVETRSNHRKNEDLMGLANLKVDFSPTPLQKWYYNGQAQISDLEYLGELQSGSRAGENNFETNRNDKNISVKQYIEWHRSYNLQHTTTMVINHSLDHTRPQITWLNDAAFLTEFLPIQADEHYHLFHIERQKNNQFDALFKHYWVLSRFGQLHTTIGNNHGTSQLLTQDYQRMSDGTNHDFAGAGFGNDLRYRLNDAYFGLDYKILVKKLSSTISLYTHWYQLDMRQTTGNRQISKWLLEPAWLSEYKFGISEKLNLDYRLRNTFPHADQLGDRFGLSSYNTVYKGNALLENGHYHSAMLRYHKFGGLEGHSINAMLTFNRRLRNIRDELVFEGVDHFRMPILMDHPETNWNASLSYNKVIWKLRPAISAHFGWFDYSQTVNEILSNNQRTNQSMTLGLRTADKKWPDVQVNYTKNFTHLKGLNVSDFETDRFNARMGYRFLKGWLLEGNYDYFQSLNKSTSNLDTYHELHGALDFQPENSAWGFRLIAHNLLANKSKASNSITDFLISERMTYVMPRMLLLSVRYKL